MLTPVMLLGILLASLLFGAAYRVLPYRFGVPLVVILIGAYFAWLFVLSQGGLTRSEGEQLSLAAAAGIVGWLLAIPVVSVLRHSKRRRTADA